MPSGPCRIVRNRCRHEKPRHRGLFTSTARLHAYSPWLTWQSSSRHCSPERADSAGNAPRSHNGMQGTQIAGPQFHRQRAINPSRDRR